jgi:parallel beta-helix repeat protein
MRYSVRVSRLGVALLVAGLLGASPASATVICVPSTGIAGTCDVAAASIGAGIALASPGGGDLVLVGPGTWSEFVVVDRSVALRSTGGRAVTTIAPPATPTATLGTVRVAPGVNAVEIGGPSSGFTIQGVDNLSPGIESAAVYFQGNHSIVTVRDNEIVAAGDAALMTEFGAVISGFLIQGNVFSGQTFTGPTPAGSGFGQQFTLPNVPRQLVVIGGGAGGGNTSSVSFIGNQVTGSAGGINASAQEQGNNLVTIDTNGGTISGNTFAGTTTRFGVSFRARGPNTVITGNTFASTGLESLALGLPETGHLFIQSTGADLATIVAANTFDKGVYVNATTGTLGLSIELAVSAVPPATTVEVLPGVYDEQVSITTSNVTVNATGAIVRPTSVVSDVTQGSPCSNGVGTAIVLVSGATGVTLNGLTIDGSLISPMPARFIGLYFRNASGAVNGGAVMNVKNSPLDGAQNGQGIYIQAKGPNVAAVDVTGVTISGIQKNGITYNGCGCADAVDGVATGTLSNSLVTGAGDVPVIAQNGVQVGFGAGPVTITGNTVTGHRYTGNPANGTSSNILVFSAKNNVITDNEISDGNYGIVLQGGSFGLCLPGDSTGNVASCNRITGHDLFSYDAGVSADAAANTIEDNAITGNTTGIDGTAIGSGTLDAENNWFGCATGPNTAGCDTTDGAVDATPFRAAIPPCLTCSADAQCDDGLTCTGSETCQAGSCVAGTPVDCSPSSDQCNVGTCTEPAGSCIAVPQPNGTACTSGDVCNVPDTCQGGVCLSGGVGDADGDTICDTYDNCPLHPNPSQRNIDGEDGGDPCDPSEGALNPTRVRLKASGAGPNPTGTVQVKGDFLASLPGEVFTPSDGITLVVEDALGQSRTITFAAGDCTIKPTKITCRTPNKASKASFTRRPTAPGLWRFTVSSKKQPLAAPFLGPVDVVLSYDAGVDRTGIISDCAANFSRLTCREF